MYSLQLLVGLDTQGWLCHNFWYVVYSSQVAINPKSPKFTSRWFTSRTNLIKKSGSSKCNISGSFSAIFSGYFVSFSNEKFMSLFQMKMVGGHGGLNLDGSSSCILFANRCWRPFWGHKNHSRKSLRRAKSKPWSSYLFYIEMQCKNEKIEIPILK